MLVLTRKIGERIVIGDNITLEVLKVCGDRVRLGVVAPNDVRVHRQEVFLRVQAEEAELSASDAVTASVTSTSRVIAPVEQDADVLPMVGSGRTRRPTQDDADRRRRSLSRTLAEQTQRSGLRSRVQARAAAANTR